MTRDLLSRLRRLERGKGPPPTGYETTCCIVVIGGVPSGLHAVIPHTEHQLDAYDDGEPLPAFTHRAKAWAGELGAEFVVISGSGCASKTVGPV
jgi:hypothetical protein